LQAMLGYSADELRGMHFTQFTHPSHRDIDSRLFAELLSGQRDYFRVEKRYVGKDGRNLWGHLTVSLARDAQGQPHFAVGIIRDITQRKHMEAELAEMRRRLARSREDERLHLSQDLHDGPLQELHSAEFELQALSPTLDDDDQTAHLENMRTSLHRAARALRAICGDLRPPTLTPFGLAAAMRAFSESFQQEHPDLSIGLDLADDGQLLPEPTRLVLFRIYQQALTNVVRHASAQNVLARFRLDEEELTLQVTDDGCGFQVPEHWIELARQGHLGLVGMAERAESVGGRLEVRSSPGAGTTLSVKAPLQYDG
jgi:PAS domain S-box-containing protein